MANDHEVVEPGVLFGDQFHETADGCVIQAIFLLQEFRGVTDFPGDYFRCCPGTLSRTAQNQ
jgi:hypothetical protein